MNMKNIKALRLTNITRYEDVEEGQLVLTINDHEKSWKAIWLSVLLHSVNGGLSLPRKTLPLWYRHYHGWVDCPRINLTRQTYMWIEPLNCCSWIDMGVNLYLCSSAGWPEPLPRYDYKNFVQALLSYNISEITIDEPIVTITNSRFHPNNIMGMEDFWDK
jgi:hypothetical protein